jgi:hypothetical protein
MKILRLFNAAARQAACQAILAAPEGWIMKLSEPTRTLEQNAAQWPILDAFSKQLKWPVNGAMVWMEPEEWKDVLTAGFRKEQARLAMGLDGGVVMLGLKTREFGRREFSDWLEFLHATAAARDVKVYEEAA